MKRLFCAILAFFLLLGLASCANTAKDWQKQYDLGMRYLEDGDYEEAILAFSAAIEIDGSRPEAYMGRAEAYIAIGEPEKALKDLKKARRAAINSDSDYEDLIDELEQRIEEMENPTVSAPEGEPLTKILQYFNVGGGSYLWRVYRFTYDDQGNLATRTVEEYSESGDLMNTQGENYTFDSAGRVTQVWDITFGTVQRSYTYDADGKLLSWESADMEFTQTYDENGNLLRRETSDGFETVEYTCEDGRIVAAQATYDVGDTYSYTFTYDDADRLATEYMVGDGYTSQTVYCYDYFDFVAYHTNVTMLESSFNIAMWDTCGNYLWSMAMSVDSELTVEGGYLTAVEDTGEWYGPCTYLLFYGEEEQPQPEPVEPETTEPEPTEPEPTEKKITDRYEAYKEYFYAHYSDSDMVYLADVTHDDKLDMLVVHLSDAEGSEIDGRVYTVVDGVITEIYHNHGSSYHAGGFYAWYLNFDKESGCYNLCEESFGMWQGYGTLAYWEYMVKPDGTVVKVYESSVSGEPVTDGDYAAYTRELRERLAYCEALYYTYSEGGGAPLLDTSPASVFAN